MVQDITELSQLNSFLEQHDIVVVDFWATWCNPCIHISPFFNELSSKYQNVSFLKVDIDQAEDLVATQDIQCIPTFKIYKNKVIHSTIQGADEQSLEETILNILNPQ